MVADPLRGSRVIVVSVHLVGPVCKEGGLLWDEGRETEVRQGRGIPDSDKSEV